MTLEVFEIDGLFKIGHNATDAKTTYGYKSKTDAEIALSHLPKNQSSKVMPSQVTFTATGDEVTASGV